VWRDPGLKAQFMAKFMDEQSMKRHRRAKEGQIQDRAKRQWIAPLPLRHVFSKAG
jgi:hypothetical protein